MKTLLLISISVLFLLPLSAQSQEIRDKYGAKIGTAKEVDKREAAVLFFFKCP